jgi:hypothetical protein
MVEGRGEMAKRIQSYSMGMHAFPRPGLANECFDAQMKANARAGQMWLDSWTKLTGEMTSFAMKRWTGGAEMFRRCCACRTPMELLELQAEFVQRMLGDYMREAARLADMETDAATAKIGEMDRGVREAAGMVGPGSPARGLRAKPVTRH